MKVFFTDRVTTDFVDVDYVNDLKLDQSQNFFNYAADKKKIWYEFLCDYKGKPWYVFFFSWNLLSVTTTDGPPQPHQV